MLLNFGYEVQNVMSGFFKVISLILSLLAWSWLVNIAPFGYQLSKFDVILLKVNKPLEAFDELFEFLVDDLVFIDCDFALFLERVQQTNLGEDLVEALCLAQLVLNNTYILYPLLLFSLLFRTLPQPR